MISLYRGSGGLSGCLNPLHQIGRPRPIQLAGGSQFLRMANSLGWRSVKMEDFCVWLDRIASCFPFIESTFEELDSLKVQV